MSKPLKQFLDKKRIHNIDGLEKSETIFCPDCETALVKNDVFVGCVCFGDMPAKGVKLLKGDLGFKVQFSPKWDEGSIEMLLALLRNKNNT